MKEIYSIEDLKSRKDGKCWVVQIKNKEQYNFLLNYFPNIMMSYDLIYDGYLVDLTNAGKSHFSSYWEGGYNKITINQIKEYVMKEKEQLDNNNTEKKIRHYIVQKQCWGIKGREWQEGEILYATNKCSLPYFKEIGLLDNTNYFTPVFEPEKPKEKVITLSNNKLIKVTKGGLFVENKFIFIKYVEALFNVDQRFGNTDWKVQINNFDIGCYKYLNRKDLENILEAYKSLN